MKSLTPNELVEFLKENPQAVLLDIREEEEIAICHLDNFVHIPMNLVTLRHNELPDDAPIVVYCHHGMRSLNVARFLEHTGFEQIYNLKGGIDAWAQTVAPDMPRY